MRQFWILDGNGLIDGGVAGDIGSIVGKRAQSEGVFVGVLALLEQFDDEITATDVVHQIAEFHAAKRIVAEVLDHGATVGVTVRFGKLFFRQIRKSLQKKRPKLIGPSEVDNFFVGEDGVSERSAGTQQRSHQHRHDADSPPAAATENSARGEPRPNSIF